MDNVIEVPLAVTIAREAADSPWIDYTWRPVEVSLEQPAMAAWHPMASPPGVDLFHAGTLTLELHRKETAGYIANLTGADPGIYVIIRQGSATIDDTNPVHVHLVTASAHDVEAYGHLGDEVIGKVAIPEPLLELLHAFIAHHHKEEVFKKRKRTEHHVADEHKFGQEPIHLLRERMSKSGRKPEGEDR